MDANPSGVSTASPTSTHPCRITRGRGGLVMRERAVDVFEHKYVIFADVGVSVHEDDAVRVVDTATGTELLPISKVASKRIASDGLGVHHLEVEVWSQAGPRA